MQLRIRDQDYGGGVLMDIGLQIYLVVVVGSMGSHRESLGFCGWLGRLFWWWLLGRFFFLRFWGKRLDLPSGGGGFSQWCLILG